MLMSDQLVEAEARLVETLAETARGPRQNAVFALWLVVRQCDGLLPPDPLPARVARARFALLEKRLTSLSLPAPLRRALPAALREIATCAPERGRDALQLLVAPAREAAGASAADAIQLAVRAARAATRGAATAGRPASNPNIRPWPSPHRSTATP
jgi:hypothetical protein